MSKSPAQEGQAGTRGDRFVTQVPQRHEPRVCDPWSSSGHWARAEPTSLCVCSRDFVATLARQKWHSEMSRGQAGRAAFQEQQSTSTSFLPLLLGEKMKLEGSAKPLQVEGMKGSSSDV